MKASNLFSFHRFWLLCQQYIIVNKRMIGISIFGFAGLIFLMLFLFQSLGKFHSWRSDTYYAVFLIFYLALGAAYSSSAFPAFRSKERCMFYLILPATAFEKYLLEFLVYVIGFIILMPLLYFMMAYLESASVHLFNTQFETFYLDNKIFNVSYNGFPISSGFYSVGGFAGLAALESNLLVSLIFFTGASYFAKSPLLKTTLTIIIIAIGFYLLSLLLSRIFYDGDAQWNSGKITLYDYAVVSGAILNISLLLMAYFKLKEKEV